MAEEQNGYVFKGYVQAPSPEGASLFMICVSGVVSHHAGNPHGAKLHPGLESYCLCKRNEHHEGRKL